VTVCIAAICEEGSKVVVVSDKMLTAGDLEFEHPGSKIIKLGASCVAMTAGSGLRHIELMKGVKKEVEKLAAAEIEQIAEKVKEEYQAVRLKRAEELYLRPRGLKLQQYHRGELPSPDITMTLDHQIRSYDFDLDIIVAGVDREGAHIFAIYNPGTFECFDAIGYHAIGSGLRHATFNLIERGHSHTAKLCEAMWAVFEGKKKAERAPGVGKESDFAVVENGAVWYFDKATTGALEGLYEEEEGNKIKGSSALCDKLAKLPTNKGPAI
jgi:20S proteasome alpha/beta subunit